MQNDEKQFYKLSSELNEFFFVVVVTKILNLFALFMQVEKHLYIFMQNDEKTI
jgi:hypothetical protein